MNKIILIEDHEINQRLIGLYLRDTEVDLDCALDYDEFEKIFEKDKYDIAIIDLSLPGDKSGKDVFEYIKKNDENVKIIINSAHTEKQMYYLNNGADEFLPKPFMPDSLIRKIETLLNKKIY